MGLILVYVMFRFEFRFGVGAVMALAHDIIITLGVFSVLEREITVPVIAAMLTIVGYSLNDTIVVFDRIRENLKRRYTSYTEIVNTSVNQTLSRTVITSGTTLIVVIIPLLFWWRNSKRLRPCFDVRCCHRYLLLDFRRFAGSG